MSSRLSSQSKALPLLSAAQPKAIPPPALCQPQSFIFNIKGSSLLTSSLPSLSIYNSLHIIIFGIVSCINSKGDC